MFMATQFEPYGDGYVYRANAVGPALPATRAEYDAFVRAGGRNLVLNLAGFFVSVILAAVLTAHWFPSGDEAGGFVLMGLAMLAIGFGLYRSIAWGMLAPQRALAGRTPVAPARTRQEAATARRASAAAPQQGGEGGPGAPPP